MQFRRVLIPFTHQPSSALEPEVDLKTSWKVLRWRISAIRTRGMACLDDERVKLSSPILKYLWVVLLLGLPPCLGMVFVVTFVIGNWPIFAVVAYLCGALFLALLLTGTIVWQGRPVVLDRRRGTVRLGWRQDGLMWACEERSIADVHALQVLNKRRWCLEVNIVYKDGSRMNLFDDGFLASRPVMCRDMKVIAEFLGVPVWDNTAAAALPLYRPPARQPSGVPRPRSAQSA